MPAPLAERSPAEGVTRPVGVVLACGAVALLLLPAFSTFGELLTDLALATGFDAALGQWVAPVEAQLAHGVFALVGLRSAYDGSLLSVSDGIRGTTIYISWNCVGWQTLAFLGVSMLAGLQGAYTARSRLETVLVGLLGVAVLNVFRITVVALVALRFGQLPAIVVHDYGTVIASVIALMAFWVFAYEHLLERSAPRA